MTQKERARKRAATLEELRKTHQETIKRAQRLLKSYNESKDICALIEDDPKRCPRSRRLSACQHTKSCGT